MPSRNDDQLDVSATGRCLRYRKMSPQVVRREFLDPLIMHQLIETNLERGGDSCWRREFRVQVFVVMMTGYVMNNRNLNTK